MTLRPPAPRPCESCPYRCDVPSGVWAAEEYDKLRDFDNPLGARMLMLFQCHQEDGVSPRARLCAGWVGCHGADSIAMRLAVRDGLDRSVFEYSSPVPLFASGAEAADHGQADIERPGDAATRVIDKVLRARPDVGRRS